MKAINCIADQDKFDALNTKVQAYLVANVADYAGTKWTDGIVHPISGDLGFLVEDRILVALTNDEQSEVITLDSTWFPTPD